MTPPPPPGRILGIDYGRKRVGVAVSDPTGILATGVTVLERTRALAADVCRIAAELGATAVVVGLPLTLRGERGPMAREVQRFVDELGSACGLPVVTVDERFTSAEARETRIAMGVPRRKRRSREDVDRMAAAIILQGYLDDRSAAPPARTASDRP